MTNKEYNGWYNYETWLVNLWMTNDQNQIDYWKTEASRIYNEAKAGTTFTRDEQAALDLMEQLKASMDEANPLTEGFWADLIGAALSEVNFHELAVHLIDAVVREMEPA